MFQKMYPAGNWYSSYWPHQQRARSTSGPERLTTSARSADNWWELGITEPELRGILTHPLVTALGSRQDHQSLGHLKLPSCLFFNNLIAGVLPHCHQLQPLHAAEYIYFSTSMGLPYKSNLPPKTHKNNIA